MKKIYLFAATLLASATLFGQTNLSFEDWDTGEPVDWFTYNVFATLGTVSTTPITQMTNNPSDGASYLRSETFALTNSTNANIPDGTYGGYADLEFASTDEYSSVTVDVKYDIQGSDAAGILLVGLDANGDAVRLGAQTFTGSTTDWETVTFSVNSIAAGAPTDWSIRLSSSAEEILTQQPAAVLGSVLDVDNIVLTTANPVPNVTNVVATDIDDNCDGTDLQVSFDVPDETNIASYFILVTTPNITPGMLADPAAAFETLGIEITPNGQNQTYVFAATDEYYFVDGQQLGAAAITDNEAMVVHVYVQPNTGFDGAFEVSNSVTLDCPTSNLTKEALKAIRVYPNPASEFINFDFGNNTASTLTITNVSGQVVSNVNVNSNKATVSVSEFDKGIYFYNAIDANGNVITTNKFVVTK